MKAQIVYEIKVGQLGAILTDRITILAADFPAAFEKAQKYCKSEDFEEEPDILSIEQIHILTVV